MENSIQKHSISSKSSICIDEQEVRKILRAYELADTTEDEKALGDLLFVLGQWYTKYSYLIKD